MENKKYQWYALGDINAFFGLLLDNVAGLFLIVSILSGIFGVPSDFIVTHMIPGTAIGVFIGDMWFFFMAFRLAKKTGNTTVTAMPLGLDTPSIFGITFLVLGPAYVAATKAGLSESDAAMQAWHVGILCMIASGLFKFVCAFFSEWVRSIVPRAGLLGSLTAIALVVISFLPLLDIMLIPAAGMIALSIVLVSLLGHVPMPWKIPGSVVALVASGVVYYIMRVANLLPVAPPEPLEAGMMSGEWLTALEFGWLRDWKIAVAYLPIALPFAIATVVGGIDCTESAAAAGDEYKTNHVIGVEAIATIAAGCLGGVIQTTPYIGQPAYKAMGGRAAYNLATALAMIVIGLFGVFTVFYAYVPKAAVYPLLVFVGLEITSQSFIATPRRHFPAVAFACVPALAYLSVFFVKQLMGHPAISGAGLSIDKIGGDLGANIMTAVLISNGFIMVSLIWASGLAFAIDRRMRDAAITFGIGAALTLFGVIHSPRSDAGLFLPTTSESIAETWRLSSANIHYVWQLVAGYVLTALVFVAWSFFVSEKDVDFATSESH